MLPHHSDVATASFLSGDRIHLDRLVRPYCPVCFATLRGRQFLIRCRHLSVAVVPDNLLLYILWMVHWTFSRDGLLLVELIDDSLEETLNPNIFGCWNLKIAHSQFFRQLLTLISRDNPRQVYFIGKKHNHRFFWSVVLEKTVPNSHILEALPICYVEGDDTTLCTLQKWWD